VLAKQLMFNIPYVPVRRQTVFLMLSNISGTVDQPISQKYINNMLPKLPICLSWRKLLLKIWMVIGSERRS